MLTFYCNPRYLYSAHQISRYQSYPNHNFFIFLTPFIQSWTSSYLGPLLFRQFQKCKMDQLLSKAIILAWLTLSIFFFSTVNAQTCTTQSFTNRLFAACNDLPRLNSHLYWTYSPDNGTISIAYRAPLSSPGWIAWAINTDRTGMVGSQAVVAVRLPNGSAAAHTTRLSDYQPTLEPMELSFAVTGIKVEAGATDTTIFAEVQLPGNRTSINHVWQQGPLSSSNSPVGHPLSSANRQSTGTLDLLSARTTAGGGPGGNSRIRRQNVHGVLNAVSWGTLLPMGAIIARYMKVAKAADPAWFYLHVACQSSAYVVGVAGWGLGLKLGADSEGITQNIHRNIGISLVVLATLQVLAILARPEKDHKYRIYWNIYHHSTGYAVIVLSVFNVYKGLSILDPEKKWRHAYTGVIITLGAIALVLEAITWPVVLRRRRTSSDKPHFGTNGAVNGHAQRPHEYQASV